MHDNSNLGPSQVFGFLCGGGCRVYRVSRFIKAYGLGFRAKAYRVMKRCDALGCQKFQALGSL